MPLSADQLKAHVVWGTLETAQAKTRDALKVADVSEANLIGQIFEALTEVDRLRHVPAWKFDDDAEVLRQFDAQLQALVNSLDQAIADPEISVRSALAARLDAIALLLKGAPTAVVLTGHLAHINKQMALFNEAVSEVVDSARTADAGAQAALDRLESSYQSLTSNVASQLVRVEEVIGRLDEEFEEKAASWTAEVKGRLDQFEADATSADAERSLRGEEALDRIAELEAGSRRLVDSLARKTVSNEYAQYARLQGIAGSAWSLFAVVVAVGGAYLLFRALENFTELSVAESIFKATLSTAILGTAAFMGREAAGHRREARDAKRAQLDLNALEPFLARLDEPDAEALRKEFAQRLFGRPMANDRTQSRLGWRKDEPSEESQQSHS